MQVAGCGVWDDWFPSLEGLALQAEALAKAWGGLK